MYVTTTTTTIAAAATATATGNAYCLIKTKCYKVTTFRRLVSNPTHLGLFDSVNV